MLKLTLRFLLLALLLLTASRLGLALWQWDRVVAAGDLGAVMLGGLRIDLSLLGMLCGVPLLLAPWLGQRRLPVRLTAYWFRLCWLVLALLELATPQFLIEYDTRPNQLFVVYLTSPHEVASMLWHGYKSVLAVTLVSLLVLGWIGWRWLRTDRPDPRLPPGWRAPASIALFLLAALAARGALTHRPINPSVVAIGGDAMVNALPLNSLYSLGMAVRRMDDEHPAAALYGDMAEPRMQQLVRDAAGLSGPPLDPDRPSLHWQQASAHPPRPLDLVVIVEESLGAQYVGSLGGRGLTPELDALAADGWWFEHLYATGTRSARGLEAISAGFPPSPAESVLKLPRSQQGFFTLAQLLGRAGYRSRLVYGGEAHFDNMKAFFLGNGFDEVIDRAKFRVPPTFVGSWGASDEDLFNELHARLLADGAQPAFTLAFSVSNHTPWEYPPGRIEAGDPPDSVENTVRYADWALGQFFRRARASAYWEHTVFVVVADHDARVFGASLIPVAHFHIPALILGKGVAPRRDDRVASQIDLAPTALSLIGISAEHPMLGADLTQRSPDRALMQYGDNYGYLAGDRLLVLQPHAEPREFTWDARRATLEPRATDPALAELALAQVSWPSWAYLNQRYTLPPDNAAAPQR